MSYDLQMAWRNLLERPIQTWIPILVVALSIGLSLAVVALGDGVRQGIIRASDPFGVLVVGAKGSSQQLVLSTILLQGVPVGNMGYEVYERLQNDQRVALAVPIALGDNVGGARIIGTNNSLFSLQSDLNRAPYFQLAQGGNLQQEFDTVLGADAASALGLSVGDRFQGSHGVEQGLASDLHEDSFTVVGILQPTDSPYDRAVFTTMESVWEVHEEAPQGLNPSLVIQSPSATNDLTAVLVRPVGFSEANQLWQEFYTSNDAQAAFPGLEIGGIFDLLSQGERILNIVGVLVLVIAGLTVFLAMYSAIVAREQSIAIMRSLGASRNNILRVVLFETLLVVIGGALLGRVVGYGMALSIASWVSNQSAVPIPIRILPNLEVVLILFPLLIGILAALLPALMAYRVNVVEKLFPS